jgi:hypothetical protein
VFVAELRRIRNAMLSLKKPLVKQWRVSRAAVGCLRFSENGAQLLFRAVLKLPLRTNLHFHSKWLSVRARRELLLLPRLRGRLFHALLPAEP